MGKIILVTGGARSGKSVFAERYIERHARNVAYIATAQIYDQEMRARVDRHQARRPSHWRTYEAPLHADQVLCEAASQADAILFDCLTLYTSNLLLASEELGDAEARFSFVMREIKKLIHSAQEAGKTVVFVTNEVGMGIVPDNPLAREYRDLAGIANQKIAAEADEVYLVVSGLAVELKKIAVSTGEV